MNTGADSLPREVLVKIFSYLSYEDLVTSVQFVCTWWQQVSWEKALWKNITYEPYSSKEQVIKMLKSGDGVGYYIKMLKISPQLRALSLASVTVDSNLIQVISDSCPNLEQLHIYWDSLWDNVELIKDHPMSQVKMLRLSSALDSFMYFELIDRIFPNVESLHIEELTFIRNDLMAYLKNKQDSLHTLSISCCSYDNLCVLPCVSVCTKLKKLCLYEVCDNVVHLSSKVLENLQNISQLALWSSDFSDSSSFFTYFPNITEVELVGRIRASEGILCIIARNYPQLQKLKVSNLCQGSYAYPVMLDDIFKCAPHLDRLTHLCIQYSDLITDSGIEHLQLMPALTHLDLYDCELLTSACIKLICGFSKLEVFKFDLRYIQLPADLKVKDVKNKNLQLMFYNCGNLSALDSLRQQRLRVCLIERSPLWIKSFFFA